MGKIIVLVTSGKRDRVDFVKVRLFDSLEEASAFCSNVSDDPDDNKKHWTWAEIINEGDVYEPQRYKTS